MFSWPPTSNIHALRTLMHMEPFTHDAYTKDEDSKETFQHLQGQFHVDKGDNRAYYYLHNGLLYNLYKICIPKGERL